MPPPALYISPPPPLRVWRAPRAAQCLGAVARAVFVVGAMLGGVASLRRSRQPPRSSPMEPGGLSASRSAARHAPPWLAQVRTRARLVRAARPGRGRLESSCEHGSAVCAYVVSSNTSCNRVVVFGHVCDILRCMVW